MTDSLWRYRCFLTQRGEHVIDAWHSRISAKGRGKLARALEHLAAQPKSEWSRPHASPVGNHIYVIRFTDENRTQHRLAGHFHGNSLAFILTLTAIEKDDKYDPSDYADRASANKVVCDADFDGRSTNCFVLAAHRAEDDRKKNL